MKSRDVPTEGGLTLILDEKPLDQLREADIRRLVDEKVRELRIVEYKRQLPGENEREKREFVADVSSFANAQGGYLLYGVEEHKGEPVGIPGVYSDDPDVTMQRLHNIVESRVKPRLWMTVQPVELSSGCFVFVIKVPRSWAGPHMITDKDWCRFYSRNTTGRIVLDVQQLRAAFTERSTLTGSVNEFRASRLTSVMSGDAPLPLQESPVLVLHVIPFSAFSTPVMLHPQQVRQWFRSDQRGRLMPMGAMEADTGFCYEGFINYGRDEAYTLVFRHGAVEATKSLLRSRGYFEYTTRHDTLIVKYVQDILGFLAQMGVGMPYVIALSLVRAKGVRVVGHEGEERDIHRPDVLTQTVTHEDESACLPTVLKPVLDTIWNAAGFPQSPSFDGGGEWTERL